VFKRPSTSQEVAVWAVPGGERLLTLAHGAAVGALQPRRACCKGDLAMPAEAAG